MMFLFITVSFWFLFFFKFWGNPTSTYRPLNMPIQNTAEMLQFRLYIKTGKYHNANSAPVCTYQSSDGWLAKIPSTKNVAEPPPSKLIALTTPLDIKISANSYKFALQYKEFKKIQQKINMINQFLPIYMCLSFHLGNNKFSIFCMANCSSG